MRTRVRTVAIAITLSLGLVAAAGPPAAAAGDAVTALNYGNYHGCAVRSDRTVWCWGLNDVHQMGDGSDGDDDNRFTPVQVHKPSGVGFLTGITHISPSGYDLTCALRSDRTVRCWGDNNDAGLGDGTADTRLLPVTTLEGASPLDDVKALAVGRSHACALLLDKTVRCWGDNESGQLGDDTTDDRTTAVQVRRGGGFLGKVKAIAAGYYHTCALKTDGTVRCWGLNDNGQLATGTADDDPHPLPLTVKKSNGTPLTNVVALDAGSRHTCALMRDATVRCWGDNDDGELGDGTITEDPRFSPVKMKRGTGFLTDVVSLSAGAQHTCAVTGDGKAWCTGNAAEGELGIGEGEDDRGKATRVRLESGSFTRVAQVRAGDGLTCFLKRNQTVWCTGYNEFGQTGSGSTDMNIYFPVRTDFP